MLVVGEKEANENMVAVRRQGKGDAGVKGVAEVIAELRKDIDERVSGE
jgi:threonyl-tRNA synthetase